MRACSHSRRLRHFLRLWGSTILPVRLEASMAMKSWSKSVFLQNWERLLQRLKSSVNCESEAGGGK